MSVTPIDPTTLQTRLNQARLAYHNLITGQQARVFVDQNGERVEFTATSKAQLLSYIQELEGLLCGGGIRQVLRPLRFVF